MDNMMWQVLATGMVIGACVGAIIALSVQSFVMWAGGLVSRLWLKPRGGDTDAVG